MLSPMLVKVINILPESMIIKVSRIAIKKILNKYANIKVEGFEKIEKVEGPKIFIGNHLSNADGLIFNQLLKEKYDPTFVAGIKLSHDPITKIGTMAVKTVNIKPNSADKEAMKKIVKLVKGGENLIIFPEGTRSRVGSMIEGKKGVLLIARLTKATIIPIAMTGTEILLPINKNGDMGGENFQHADITIKVGDPVIIPDKKEDEDKHAYDERALEYMMRSIANMLPEKYRGIYK